MRDRYSILVGLVFVAVVVIAVLNGAGGGGGTLGLDRQPSHWPLPEFAVPRRRRRRSKATPTSPRTIARASQLPCPSDARRTPACRVGDAGRDPRLRPLRPALGDLVLVHARAADCVDQQDVVDRVYRALPWAGELPLAGRARRSRHGSRPDPRSAVGRCRSATTATAPSPASTGSAAARPSPTSTPAAPCRAPSIGDLERRRSSAPGSSGCCARPRGGGAAEAGRRSRPAESTRALARPGLGRPPRRRRVPRPRASPGSTSTAGPGRSPEPVRRRLRELSDRFYGVARDPPARTADPLGLPGLLPPDRPRPGPHPHPGRAARPRPPPRRCLQEPRPARGRADDRHRRDRGRAARLRPPRTDSRGRSASATRRPGSRCRAATGSCPRNHSFLPTISGWSALCLARPLRATRWGEARDAPRSPR